MDICGNITLAARWMLLQYSVTRIVDNLRILVEDLKSERTYVQYLVVSRACLHECPLELFQITLTSYRRSEERAKTRRSAQPQHRNETLSYNTITTKANCGTKYGEYEG